MQKEIVDALIQQAYANGVDPHNVVEVREELSRIILRELRQEDVFALVSLLDTIRDILDTDQGWYRDWIVSRIRGFIVLNTDGQHGALEAAETIVNWLFDLEEGK